MYDLSNDEFALIKKYVFKQNLKNITGIFFFFVILILFNLILFGYLWLEHYPSFAIIIFFILLDVIFLGATIFLIKSGNLKIKYLDNVIVQNIKGKFISKTHWTGDYIDTEYFINDIKILVPKRLKKKLRHSNEINARVANVIIKTKNEKSSNNINAIQNSLLIGLND